MPTVKLHSSGKVILKDGKVSCSCCAAPETCCMYPADGLDVTYTADDLPDAVTFDPGYGEITLTRSGDTYAGGGYTLIPGMAAGWYLSDAEPTKEWDSSCLFGTYGSLRPLSHGSTTVEDQFADCYEVSRLYVVSGTLGSTYCPEFDTWVDHYVDEQEIENIVLVRSGLCNWTALVTLNIYYQCPEDENRQIFSTDYPRVNLSYNPSGDGKLWSLTCDQPLNPGFSTKDGLQNHPGGTYDGTPFDDIIVTPVLCP
jgi:hypothetical protein